MALRLAGAKNGGPVVNSAGAVGARVWMEGIKLRSPVR